jgi:hypothetical protein
MGKLTGNHHCLLQGLSHIVFFSSISTNILVLGRPELLPLGQ